MSGLKQSRQHSDSHTIESAHSDKAVNSEDPLKLEPISTYLENLTEDQASEYLVPDKVLLKYAMAMDIVRPSCSRSCCFTRAYGHYAVGTGSVVQQCLEKGELDVAFEGYKKAVEESEAGTERFAQWQLTCMFFLLHMCCIVHCSR